MKQRIDVAKLSVLAAALVAVCTPARSGEGGPPTEAVSYESFAFAPAPGPGPEVTLSDPKAGPWTRVIFAPRALTAFPEDLRFLRDLPAPVAGIAGLALSADAVWAAGRTEKRIVRMDRRSGAVTASMAAPGPEPGALHWDGAELWHADGSGRIFALREDGTPRLEIALGFKPGAFIRQGDLLLVADAAAGRFHRVRADGSGEAGTDPAPHPGLTGLSPAPGGLWCAAGSEVFRFDQARGLPVCGFNASAPHPEACAIAGLALDGAEMWMADAAAGRIRAIRTPAHGEIVASAGRYRKTRFSLTYRNTSAKAWESLRILQNVPFFEMPGQRYISLRIVPEPQALWRDDLGNLIALIDFGRVEPGAAVRCEATALLWTADRRQVVDPALFPAGRPGGLRGDCLEDFFPIAGAEDPQFIDFLKASVGDEANPYWIIRKGHDAICAAIRYDEPGLESVAQVLRLGRGVCRHYSAILQAFGRRFGVPVINSWAPHHETCYWMLPGIQPTILEVTADDTGPEPSTAWSRSRWFLGTQRDEITTGVRGRSMHCTVRIDSTPFIYDWHYWRPVDLQGLVHERGGWAVLSTRRI